MRGTVPVWLFVLCLVVGMATAFVAGYHWTRLVRRARLHRQAAAARARFEKRTAETARQDALLYR